MSSDAADEAFAVGVGTLTKGRLLGTGGQGSVYVASALPGQFQPLVYKEYAVVVRNQLNHGALEKMVRFRQELPAATDNELCERAAWPLAVVLDAGRPSGFLMRQIPDAFNAVVRFPNRATRMPMGVQMLLNPPDFLHARELTVDDDFRLALLRHVAETIRMLHSHDIAVGDLSPANIFFSPDSARSFFLDCDAMRLRGASVLAQAETPEWELPTGEELATPAGDRYKFGLLAVRLFAGDQSTQDSGALWRKSVPLANLASRAMSRDPANRPDMDTWIAALQSLPSSEATALERPPSVNPPLKIEDIAEGRGYLPRLYLAAKAVATSPNATTVGLGALVILVLVLIGVLSTKG